MAVRYHFEQTVFTGQQAFSPLAILDIVKEEVPASDPAIGIPERQSASVKPPIYAIKPTHAMFHVIWNTRLDGNGKGCNRLRKVLGMNGVAVRPLLQLLGRLAEILQNLAAQKLDLPRRGRR